MQNKYHCACFYLQCRTFQKLDGKHSILEQQRAVLVLPKIRQHAITSTL